MVESTDTEIKPTKALIKDMDDDNDQPVGQIALERVLAACVNDNSSGNDLGINIGSNSPVTTSPSPRLEEITPKVQKVETDQDTIKASNNDDTLNFYNKLSNPLLTIHKWLFFHVPPSTNLDEIYRTLNENSEWSVKEYFKLTSFIEERAKILEKWGDCPSSIAIKNDTEHKNAVSHIVNLYRYRDVSVLKLDEDIENQARENKIKEENINPNRDPSSIIGTIPSDYLTKADFTLSIKKLKTEIATNLNNSFRRILNECINSNVMPNVGHNLVRNLDKMYKSNKKQDLQMQLSFLEQAQLLANGGNAGNGELSNLLTNGQLMAKMASNNANNNLLPNLQNMAQNQLTNTSLNSPSRKRIKPNDATNPQTGPTLSKSPKTQNSDKKSSSQTSPDSTNKSTNDLLGTLQDILKVQNQGQNINIKNEAGNPNQSAMEILSGQANTNNNKEMTPNNTNNVNNSNFDFASSLSSILQSRQNEHKKSGEETPNCNSPALNNDVVSNEINIDTAGGFNLPSLLQGMSANSTNTTGQNLSTPNSVKSVSQTKAVTTSTLSSNNNNQNPATNLPKTSLSTFQAIAEDNSMSVTALRGPINTMTIHGTPTIVERITDRKGRVGFFLLSEQVQSIHSKSKHNTAALFIRPIISLDFGDGYVFNPLWSNNGTKMTRKKLNWLWVLSNFGRSEYKILRVYMNMYIFDSSKTPFLF